MDEELDEDDLELLRENTGMSIPSREETNPFKRLKRGRHSEREELEEDLANLQDDVPSSRKSDWYHDHEDSHSQEEGLYEEDVDDFIDYDEDEEGELAGEEGEDGAPARRSSNHRTSAPDGSSRPRPRPSGMDGETEMEIGHLFNDGLADEYAWAMEEEEEGEGGEGELGAQVGEEEAVLAERMLTTQDEEIRVRDEPERRQQQYQYTRQGPGFTSGTTNTLTEDPGEEETPTEEELDREVEKRAIRDAVKFLRTERLEVPALDLLRRDYFEDWTEQYRPHPQAPLPTRVLGRSDLWEIARWDRGWRGVEAQAQEDTEEDGEILKYAARRLDQVTGSEDVSDILHLLRMRFGKELSAKSSSSSSSSRTPSINHLDKRAGGGGAWDMVRSLGPMRHFLRLFGITAREFGENLRDGVRHHWADDATEDPQAAAQEVIHRMSSSLSSSSSSNRLLTNRTIFKDPVRVVETGRSVIAELLASDPLVRMAVRDNLKGQARVSIHLTDQGSQVIDASHPVYPFKYVRNKSEDAFVDGQFLQMCQAETDGLVRVEVIYPSGVVDGLIQRAVSLYIGDGYSEAAERWNRERAAAVRRAFEDRIIPETTRWVRGKLRAKAEAWVSRRVYQEARSKLRVAPYRRIANDPTLRAGDSRSTPRILSLSWGEGRRNRDGIEAIILGGSGKIRAHAAFPDLRDHVHQLSFISFMRQHTPDLVLVSGFSVSTRRLLDQVRQLINGSWDSDLAPPHDSSSSNLMPPIELGLDETALLYIESPRAHREVPGWSRVAKLCLGVARRHQCPVREFAILGIDNIRVLQWHSLQHLIPQDHLVESLERALVDAVSDLGVDVNEDGKEPFYGGEGAIAMLQYVPGLGPRKVAALIKQERLEGSGLIIPTLRSRTDLITLKLMGKWVFMNAAPFLRLVGGVDVLDATRIHPADYELARKMAANARDEEEADPGALHPSDIVRALQDRGETSRLNELNLKDYADMLEARFHQPKRAILEAIKMELQVPYKDHRIAWTPLGPSQAFSLLSRTTDSSLHPGTVTLIQVTGVRDGPDGGQIVHGALENGLDVVVKPEYQPSSAQAGGMGGVERYSPGQMVRGVVINLLKGRFLVEASFRPEDVRSAIAQASRGLNVDPAFDREAEERDARRKAAARHRAKVRQQQRRRVLNHPLFRQASTTEAEAYLADKAPGDCVIRGSSRGTDHIAVTWKVAQGIYEHLDVVEKDKPNEYSMGQRLLVGSFEYADLDDLVVNHVEAMSKLVNELAKHPRCVSTPSLDALHTVLNNRVMAQEGRVAYGFCLNSERAGTFYLSWKYKLGSDPVDWVVKVNPGGYILNRIQYPSVSKLLEGFKKQGEELRRK
ncbi:MAG: SH2 domain-containing protein, partial [Piptocephalis tieghemiana]